MNPTQNISRKRPAPGANPIGYPQLSQPMQQAYPAAAQIPQSDDDFFNWGAAEMGGAPMNNPLNQPQQFQALQNQYMPLQKQALPAPQQSQPSNQVIRRPAQNMNQAKPVNQFNQNQVMPSAAPPQDAAPGWTDNVEELEQQAQIAKRESLSRRKQIPPFVLKLHSFLDNPKNADLIRWSNDGTSFVVLNEDEFANKLIPELFKHNNYASFVRQLNMYGFHKKVGLSDNSMRASEKKAKSPSEYSNPFFRKGHPDLLWLISKPKNAPPQPRKGVRAKSEDQDDVDSLDDVPEINNRTRPQITMGGLQQSQALTQEQFQTVQRELAMIRHNQSQITSMLGALKREHDALVHQAGDYQNKHSQHENSINAILTFLASLYNNGRNIQSNENAQNMARIISSGLKKEHSTVVDLGDNSNDFVFDMPAESVVQNYQPNKRQRLLLTDGSIDGGRANTLSPSSHNSPIPKTSRTSSHSIQQNASPKFAQVEELNEPDVKQSPSSYESPSTQQDMMAMIHSTNAQNNGASTRMADLGNLANEIDQNMTQSQRDNMIRMFQQQQQASSRPPSQGSTSMLVSPKRSPAQIQFDHRLKDTSNNLESLAQMQAAQDKSVENLANLLQPLSPSGSIPGIHDNTELPPPPLNIDDFLSTGDYFNMPTDSDGNYDFSGINGNAYANNSTGNINPPQHYFEDDDSMFGDVGNDNNQLTKTNSEFFNQGNDGDYVQPADGDSGGQVESVPSSQGASSPRKDSTKGET